MDKVRGSSAGPPQARRQTNERRCAICGTALSRYNEGPYCWAHTVGWPWRGPTAKPRY